MSFPESAEAWEEFVAGQLPEVKKLRVYRLEKDGDIAWLKFAEKNHHNPIDRAIRAWKMRGNPDRDKSNMQLEAAEITKYRDKGYTVPDVLYMNQKFMVLSHVGDSLQDLMNHATPEERERIVLSAARALHKMHLRGDAHGGAALRNLTQAPDGVGFIDFEEAAKNPQLLRSQLTDIWQLAHATSKFDHSGELTAKMLREYGITKTRMLLLLAMPVLAPVAYLLKPGFRFYKRDMKQTIACVDGILKSAFK